MGRYRVKSIPISRNSGEREANAFFASMLLDQLVSVDTIHLTPDSSQLVIAYKDPAPLDILNTHPVDGELAATPGTNLVLFFDEDISGFASDSIHAYRNGVAISGWGSAISGESVTLAGLINETPANYTVIVPPSTATGAMGSVMLDAFSVQFTTT